MRSKKTVSVFFSIAFAGAGLFMASAAWAQSSNLMFHGQLVNAACEAKVFATGDTSSTLKPLTVNARLTLRLVSHDDACGEVALPVSVAYAERAAISTHTHNGIVTLTYQ
jgi:type 1 fimbria pilin